MSKERPEFAQNGTKAAVTVAEMARMVGLSRARFYQLIGTAFPHPVHCVKTRRLIYVQELQEVCLEVRRRTFGVDGKAVLFYSRRIGSPALPIAKVKSAAPKSKAPRVHEWLDSIRSLGLANATSAEISAAVKALFPKGSDSIARGEVIKAVFLHLQCQDSADKVGR